MFSEFLDWLFNENIKDKVENHPEFIKYNSPITITYLISLFTLKPELNNFLDEHFNNYSLYYLDKADLFNFIKKCVIDFKIKKNIIQYTTYHHKKESKLFQVIQKKFPNLKKSDALYLCNLIDKRDDKNDIYVSLGIDDVVKSKDSSKIKKTKKFSYKNLIETYFDIQKM